VALRILVKRFRSHGSNVMWPSPIHPSKALPLHTCHGTASVLDDTVVVLLAVLEATDSIAKTWPMKLRRSNSPKRYVV